LLSFWALPKDGTTQYIFQKGTNVMHARALVDRVRGEFNEMPGLQLTIPQAARLLGIEHDKCRDVIETLVASSFLRKTSAGTVVRTER
jgi:hypothetical protein